VYSVDPITLLVGTSDVRDAAAEAGCHWRDPELGIPWPFATAIVSAQDGGLGRLRDVLGSVPSYEPGREDHGSRG
jgi:dTDP-4-dehydrorhamnose 3,5-epimerase-like enzyme